MDKTFLLNMLKQFITDFYCNTYAVFSTFESDPRVIEKKDVTFIMANGKEVVLKGADVAAIFEDADTLRAVKSNFYSGYKNFIIAESFEYILSYCKASSSSNKDKLYNNVSHPHKNLMDYARVLRNNLNHFANDNIINWAGYTFEEVTWRDRTIRRGMTGNEIGVNFNETIILIQDLIVFVETELE